MISLLVAAIVFQTPTGNSLSIQDAPKVTAASLISAMFLRYTNAVSLVGTIQMVQEAKGQSVTTDTVLQYTRPNKIYLKQTEHSSEGRSFLLTSDGKTFSYDKPKNLHGPDRCVEYTRTQYQLLDLGDMYTATLNSIVDPSQILNVAIGRRPDLIKLTHQISGYQIVGNYKVGSDTIYQIAGRYSLEPNLPAAAEYQIDVSESGDFKRFVIKQMYGIPNHPEMPAIPVTTTWTSTLQVDGTPTESLYRTIK